MLPILLPILLLCLAVAGFGLYLARKYHADATYDGIGGFDGSPRGCLGVLGGFMVLVGLIGAGVAGFLVYVELFK